MPDGFLDSFFPPDLGRENDCLPNQHTQLTIVGRAGEQARDEIRSGPQFQHHGFLARRALDHRLNVELPACCTPLRGDLAPIDEQANVDSGMMAAWLGTVLQGHDHLRSWVGEPDLLTIDRPNPIVTVFAHEAGDGIILFFEQEEREAGVPFRGEERLQ